jgi:hypothetical protein
MHTQRKSPMNADLPQTVLDAAAVSAITQLVLTERESRDLGRWESLGACYLPDSHVEISWISGTGAEFVAGSIEMARRDVRARHRLGPVRVRLNGDRALASLSAVIDIPGEIEGVDFCLCSHARLLYPVEYRDGYWGLIPMGTTSISMTPTPRERTATTARISPAWPG